MAAVYDNWERLVRATIRREDLRLSGMRTPSDLSLASLSPFLSPSSSFNFSSPSTQLSSSTSSNSSLPGDSFTYHQILQVTNYLSSSNLIMYGRSGDFFYGVLERGIQVAVKKVDLSSSDKSSFLTTELEFYAKVSHPKFVPLLGHCLEYQNHKFLVYKYMPNLDLLCCLKFGIIDGGVKKSLDWEKRLKIANGVAYGLHHLHHQCVPPLVHRNVEASSIMLDENYDAVLGRLFEVCSEEKDRNPSEIPRLLRFQKSSERGSSGASNATCAYDVYCFGKVLLQLVTGNLGFSDYNDSRKMDLMEITLPYITTDDKELFMNIVDPRLTMDEHLLIEVWAVAVVAKACLNPEPSKRPQMTNVLEALQEPKSVRFSTYGSPPSSDISAADLWNSQISSASGSEETYLNWEVWDIPKLMQFKLAQLKAATKNFRSDGFLGEGGFGIVYRGWLNEDSTSKSGTQSPVAVKRLKPDSMQGFQEWENEISMLGRLSHPNLIKLRGYCNEDKELLLVYEYMQKGSLNNHLFGRGSAVQPLSWDTRLKILIGAARGLAYLHAFKRQVIFRDFKSSSILLNSFYNAKISDFGLVRMGPPESETHVTTRVMGTIGYADPEYIATGHLCVKSDVYGFGVVMAEVLTGLRALDHNRPKGQHDLVEWIKPRLSDRWKVPTIMDSRLEGKYPFHAAVEMAQLAQTCLANKPEARPSMKQVLDTLERIQSV